MPEVLFSIKGTFSFFLVLNSKLYSIFSKYIYLGVVGMTCRFEDRSNTSLSLFCSSYATQGLVILTDESSTNYKLQATELNTNFERGSLHTQKSGPGSNSKQD